MLSLMSQLKKYLSVCFDAIMITVAYLITYLFISEPFEYAPFLATVYAGVVTYILVFLLFGVYNGIVRFFSIKEYSICFLASLVSGLLVCAERNLFSFLGSVRQHMLASVFIGVLCISLRAFCRLVLNYLLNRSNQGQKRNRLLIVGAGHAGHRVIREILSTEFAKYDIVGLIDDDKAKLGCTISGIKVIGGRDKIVKVCADKKVDMILVAIPTLPAEERKKLLDICHVTKCRVSVLPNIDMLFENERLTDHIRRVEITDLLCRDSVKLNNEAIGDLIRGRVVLVTGGGGSIGSELCRQIAKYNPSRLVILDIYENNAYDLQNELTSHFPELKHSVVIASVRERARLEEVFKQYRPVVVFHAAAHKHVPLMEENPEEAIKNNVFGTFNVAACADSYGVEKFVLISTDKAVNPTNIMGASKRICEMIIQTLDKTSQTDFAAVRFGNVLGSNGSVIPLFKKQIEEGGPVTVTHKEITRFFMTIPEAAQLVLQAASYASGGEIFVLDMGEPVKIYDLAENLIKLMGYEPGKDIEIKITGLRPGEKLYEELMMAEEGLTSTQNEKIFIAKPLHIEEETLKAGLTQMAEVIAKHDGNSIKKAVSELVSTYSPEYVE